MEPLLRGTDAFLEEMRVLNLLSADEVERFLESSTGDNKTRTWVERLVEAGLLTAYQAGKVRAGKGRHLRIGPYVLVEPLGSGGMGHVYKAEHRLMKRVVALKLVGRLRSGRRDAVVLNRFRREVESAGRVRHPSIVAAYDAGIWRGWLYLAMEYIEGIDLQRFIADTGPVSVDLACEIVRQTAEALHHAHECGFVHRDIKPSNLMLAAPGATVKLLDLGLAQLTDSSASTDINDESDEELCGTPDFMDPECGHNAGRADVRGDLYSLGCTFYYLLSGRVPFPGGSWTEKLLRHHLDEPVSLRCLRPDVPAKVAALIERLMARDPDHRFVTAAAVVSELNALYSTPSTVPEEDNAPPSSERASPRSQRGLARFCLSTFFAVILGMTVAAGARQLFAPLSPSLPTSRTSSFTLAGRPDGFPTLAEAIASAADGEIITVHTSGPFVTPPLSWSGKALTLRAAEGTRPRLELRASDEPWQALLQSDRALTLEGLELAEVTDSSWKPSRPQTPLIRCTHAPLYLTNCWLRSASDGTAIVARNPSEIIVRGCGIEAGSVSLSVEVGQAGSARIRIENTRLIVRGNAGTALSLWAAEIRRTTLVTLELDGNTIECDRFASLRDLPATLWITARDNRFLFRTALLGYSGFADRDAWRDTVWQGNGNSYCGPATWLWVEDNPVSFADVCGSEKESSKR